MKDEIPQAPKKEVTYKQLGKISLAEEIGTQNQAWVVGVCTHASHQLS
jgi:hypothetical protein